MTKEAGNMTFFQHIGELRQRIIWTILTLLVTMALGFTVSEQILDFLMEPAEKLHYTEPAEAFLTQLKIAIVAGIVIGSPVILYNIIAFILPALNKKEKRYLFISLPFALILFIVGVSFGYFIMLPIIYSFFIGFAREGTVKPIITLRSYVSFVLGLLIPFGLVFQLPMVSLILSQLDVINPNFLKINRKIVLFVIVLVAAFLTPPDVISQALMIVPLVLLFELSILVSSIVFKRKSK
ncbi:twin-arginine translocase subunit TatC [Natranaerobius trueperi]|uniref:Sec-independent protein translocase protein TatC n=1 Tax=Natranaerobius trueperi TaxID=759412 RepID=A0A226BY75_9FIRM|nr:twin-arginine translocase subunit TatC [Natranaerobius trueperi]OWZ83956.1 twin-arginine translocase subunit TatC [Natranaerobius trueperi]